MAKKEIKKRIPVSKNNTKKTTQINNRNNQKVKKRIPQKNSKANQKEKTICLISYILLVILTTVTLGIFFGLFVALGIAIIVGVSKLIKKANSDKSKKSILKTILIIILSLGVLGLVLFSGFIVIVKVKADLLYRGNEEKLNTPENTTFLDSNGEEYAKLGSEMREKVTYDQLPEVLVDAIVATEDSRFFQHNGFDAPRFSKAIMGHLIGKSNAGGASTLTMQVVKNTFTDASASHGIKGGIRKAEDIYLAIFKVEKNFTKQQIIEFYVNNHYLGGNIYGVEEAANAYFGKSVSELNLSEAAILAGMFKSPVTYRPTAYPENAAKRRKTVLYLMRRHGYITKEEEELANSIPVESLVSNGTAGTSSEYQGYIDTVVEEIKDRWGINAYTTPLLVYTNLDRSRQNAVNSVMNGESYSWINDKVQSGVAVIDTETGKILAIGNGRNVNGRTPDNINQFNYATSIKRQPGSSAKPLFDYAPGIEYNNWSTYTQFVDGPYTYSNGHSIKNWDGGYYGQISLRRALSTSRNIPALKAFQQVDNAKIRDFVARLGIHPEVCSTGYTYKQLKDGTFTCVNNNKPSETEDPSNVHEAHSIGAFTGTNPVEMAAAYSAFSNGGTYHEPTTISKIINKGSNEELKLDLIVNENVMGEDTAFMISSVLQDVNLNGGNPQYVARKTGTTNYDDNTMTKNHLPGDAIRDSWIVGYSSKTALAVWYGYDFIDSEYCLHNIPATIQKDKIFNALINAGAMEHNRTPFKQPDSVVKVGVIAGSETPKLAPSGYTGTITYEYFKKNYQPTETYTNEKLGKVDNFNASYLNKKVYLKWKSLNNNGYDSITYYIYHDSTLIGKTESTSYTYTPTGSPYGTYKVVANAYKDGNLLEGTPVTQTIKDNTSTPEQEEKDNLTLTYNGPTIIPEGGSLELSTSDFTVKNNNSPVSATLNSCTPSTIDTAIRKVIVCNVKYKNQTYNLSTTIEFKRNE